jgi:DNA gyrase subunit B
VVVDGAFQCCADDAPLLHTYANVVRTEGGWHETGFFAGLTRALNCTGRSVGPDAVLMQPLRRKQSQKGLTAVIGVLVKQAQFYSSTRALLGSERVYGPVLQTVYHAARAAFEADPDAARRIRDRFCTQAN